MRHQPPFLTLITDCTRFPKEILLKKLERALAAGLDAVLIREKELSSAKLLALASELREMTRTYGAKLYIHTQADIAVAVDADGVHLASCDIGHVRSVRGWLADSSKSVSVSCHTAAQICVAEEVAADYIYLSPLFATQSHPGAPTLGVERFAALADSSALPVVALGGIGVENVARIGGYARAVITAVLDADDVKAAVQVLSGRG